MALMWQSSISKLWTNGAVIEVLVRVSVIVWGPCIGPNQRYLSPKGYTDQVLKFIFPPKHFGGSIAPSKVSLSPLSRGGDRFRRENKFEDLISVTFWRQISLIRTNAWTPHYNTNPN